MKKPFKKLSEHKINEIHQELARAHLVISLLSIIAIVLLLLGATLTVEFNAKLSIIAGVLLSFLTLISMSTSIILFKNKR